VVLLIDEIDKADSDLPNGLLESLGNGEFHVPFRDEPVPPREPKPRMGPPLVIITTNEERELPLPFLRRCLVLHLELPTNRADLESFLVERALAHFRAEYPAVPRKFYEQCARHLADERLATSHEGQRPGQAEYLDLLRAVLCLDPSAREEALKYVRKFAFQKSWRPGV
jgi:MoxR-like ATPase